MPPHPAIDIRSARKRFGAVTAVDGITLRVEPGETVAFLGPNGAGKTTTIAMLLGLERPDEGTVLVDGLPPAEAVVRGRIAAMLQDGALMDGVTVRELVSFVRDLYPDPMPLERALSAADVGSLAGRRVDRLSGGQTQRVRFALALVGNPAVLVLDEPSAGMDVQARRSFWASMRAEAAAGRTLLFATHYLEEADANAARVVMLRQGRIVADGPAAAIKASAGTRTIRFSLAGTSTAGLDRLPAVTAVEVRGDVVLMTTTAPDDTLRALLAGRNGLPGLEVAGAALEDAFLALTHS